MRRPCPLIDRRVVYDRACLTLNAIPREPREIQRPALTTDTCPLHSLTCERTIRRLRPCIALSLELVGDFYVKRR
jgi:hypothetical protein